MNAQTCYALLPSRALVSVAGPGWRGFLQGLLTQDVETLAPGEVRFAALLTPQGKLMFDLFVIGVDGGCLLDVAAARRERLIQRLKIYRLRAKVEINAVDGAVAALWPATTNLPAGGWAVDPRLAELGFRGLDAEPPADAALVDEAAYDRHRLELGIPDPDRDCPTETTYPIEANFDLLHGIDFQKGCFVGQETASRMKRRGAVRNRMLPIRFDGDPPAFGAEVLAGERRAGQVLSGQPGRAIALLRLDRIGGAELSVDGRAVAVEWPRYLAEAV
jgi:folate-binding protein YgfZ